MICERCSENIEGTFVNHIFRYGFTTIEDKYVCSKCAGRAENYGSE